MSIFSLIYSCHKHSVCLKKTYLARKTVYHIWSILDEGYPGIKMFASGGNTGLKKNKNRIPKVLTDETAFSLALIISSDVLELSASGLLVNNVCCSCCCGWGCCCCGSFLPDTVLSKLQLLSSELAWPIWLISLEP